MSSVNVDELSNALAASTVSSSGVSFCGQALKLDTEEDAKDIVEAINNCAKLEYLNLEGNTLGVAAAKAIAKALEKHPEFKRALWKDLFTGRMKSEIPLALEHLGNALTVAGARLTEIDLSDNAFGPIGVQGLAALLRSSSCYNLQELRLNNNGLGITGGKLLASALMDCYNNSKSLGTPLALKVFIAGRNRLENDGAKALAEVFRTIGTLEEIAMPQNGIYHVGITALSDSFTHNKNLQILNLNDNTIGPKGAEAFANVLPNLQNLKQINFGDCLLRTKGAESLAKALQEKHRDLEELVLDSNEIGAKGGMALAKAIRNKNKLKTLTLGANTMGEEGRKQLENYLKDSGQITKLTSMSDNESEDEEEESGSEAEESESESDNEEDQSINIEEKLQDFLNSPTDLTFQGLGDKKKEVLVAEGQKLLQSGIDNCMGLVMKTSALSTSKNQEIGNQALDICKKLYEDIFGWPKQPEDISILNNCLLTHLCLIKSEDKKFKPTWDLNGCVVSLGAVINEKFFPISTKNTVKAFAARFKEEDKFCTVEKSSIMKLEAALQQV